MGRDSDIQAFYREVDAAVTALEEQHRERLACKRGCADCCVDELTVFEVEAENIRRRHETLLQGGLAHPPGACAFLDEDGACRIYADRPYVCRTQGLPLRWTDEDEHGAPVEYRDICTLNEDGPLITDLKPQACWTLGPYEMRLQLMQAAQGDDDLQRVSLRDLFQEGDAVDESVSD